MVNYWRLCTTYWSIHLRTAMEYRMNFFVQAGFMAINNTLFLVAMYMLVGAFGTFKGYGFNDIAIIFSISAVAFGLVSVFFGGIEQLGEDIENGTLDAHLSVPIHPLISKGLSGTSEDAVGDIVFGIIAVFLFAKSPFLTLSITLLATLLWVALTIAIYSVPFFLERSSRLTHSMRMVSLSFASWPVTKYRAGVRIIAYATLLAFLGAFPAALSGDFTWQGLALLVSVSLGALVLSIAFFTRGLRRYESGNLVGMRG